MTVRHFLSLNDLTNSELHWIVNRARTLKKQASISKIYEPLKNQVLGMIFEKSSTRTRVSFETAMAHFGGHAIFLSPRDSQLGRGEPIEDSARVLSRMVDVITIRTFEHSKLKCFADHSNVPVINALTDLYHPCQLLADMLTFTEHNGDIKGKKVAWIGDGNNMCHSYMNAAKQFEFHLTIACPKGFNPKQSVIDNNAKFISFANTPQQAAEQAELVVTDVWASMGQEQEQASRHEKFRPYQVNQSILECAKPNAIFMHCLPAHRGEEVTSEVIDGLQSVVWDEAENRLHTQKALLELLLVDPLP